MSHLALLAWIALCACEDARSRRVPNVLVLAGLVVALLHLSIHDQTLTGASWTDAAVAVLLALALTLPGYCLGRMGAGDVKMLAALGLASGPSQVLAGVLCAGAGMALWAYGAHRLWHRLPRAIYDHLPNFAPANLSRLPYIPFVFPGPLIASVLAL